MEKDRLILKFKWKYKRQEILEEKNKLGRFTLLDVKKQYKAAITKTVWCWHRNYVYLHLIYIKGGTAEKRGKDRPINGADPLNVIRGKN